MRKTRYAKGVTGFILVLDLGVHKLILLNAYLVRE
jgi:hypothetical protein